MSCKDVKIKQYMFFYKQHIYKQRQGEIGQKSRKCQAIPWDRTFTF